MRKDRKPLAVGTMLDGRYRIGEAIGRGGMGTVYRAEHVALGQAVAIKVLDGEGVSEAAVKRFEREARAAASIRHPGIVDVFDFGATGEGVPWLAMEHLEGRTLAEWLAERGAVAAGEIVPIVAQLLEALEAAHRRGIVHRDLKPANVFLADGPAGVKILDFGISKLLGDAGARITRTGEVVGTPLYMSPEQALGRREVGKATDLHAVGALTYEALVGRPPYVAETYGETLHAVINSRHTPACEARPEVPAEVSQVVDWLLAKAASDRPASAAAAKELLLAAAVGKRPERALALTVDGAAPGSRRRWLRVAAPIALAAIGGAVWLAREWRAPVVVAPVLVAPAVVAPAAAPIDAGLALVPPEVDRTPPSAPPPRIPPRAPTPPTSRPPVRRPIQNAPIDEDSVIILNPR